MSFLPPSCSVATRFSAVCFLLSFLTCVPSAPAAERWLLITSPNFELLTDAGDKRGKEAILRFEQIHGFFLQATGSESSSRSKVRIIAFRSEKEFRPYRPNQIAAAFFLGGMTRDYVVMQDLSSMSYTAAAHEYFHLWVKNTPLPLWLNEGLAEYYSTMRPMRGGVLVGEFPQGRYELLLSRSWVDLDVLLAVDHGSPYYNEQDRAGVFYSQSWALAHMLNLSPAYRPRFESFYRMVGGGTDAVSAFRDIYDKSLEDVQKDLRMYVQGGRFKGDLFDLKMEKGDIPPSVAPASDLQVGLALAEMLAARKGRQDEARKAYEDLAQQNPGRWEAQEALGYLALRNREREQARQYLARATDLGATTPKTYFDYAMLLREFQEPEASLVPLLEKAVELDPDYSDAHFYLGHLLIEAGNNSEGVQHLVRVKRLAPYQAANYFSALAMAYHRLGQLEQARSTAQQAVKNAQGQQELSSAMRLLAWVSNAPEEETALEPPAPLEAYREEPEEAPRLVRREPEEPPPLESRNSWEVVAGRLVQVDCSPEGLRLQILSGNRPVVLAITDPEAVVILGLSTGTVDFTYGRQKPVSVVVEYDKTEDGALGTAGVVKTLEFK